MDILERIDFWFDPVCPYSWTASRRLEEVRAIVPLELNYHVMSLRISNEASDESEEYKTIVNRSVGPSRVAIAAAVEHGDGVLRDLYTAFGNQIFDRARFPEPAEHRGAMKHALAVVGLNTQRIIMNTYKIDPDRLWAAIDGHRLRTAEMLDSLSDDEWMQPSLCGEWTVRDVAAHLTMQQMSFGTLLGVMLRHPGGLNTVIREASKRRAQRPKETYAPEIRAMVGSRRHNFGVTPLETLMDILVHSQDIAIPLGRDLELPVEAAGWAADRVWSFQGKGLARVFRSLPLQRMRLVATDHEWSVGTGPEIRGPMSALLLLLTGRTVAFDRLDGEGIEILRTNAAAA